MIDEFIAAFEEHKPDIESDLFALLVRPNNDYWDYISAHTVLTCIAKYLPDVDPNRITVVDYGDYQGTLVLVLGAEGYQPDRHWIVKYGYGSCSGCDALEQVCSDKSMSKLMMIALHLVQGLKEI
jgi:hypothetical protein